jgi:hypothetical protein
LMSVTITLAPSSPNRRAIAAPKPEPPPENRQQDYLVKTYYSKKVVGTYRWRWQPFLVVSTRVSSLEPTWLQCETGGKDRGRGFMALDGHMTDTCHDTCSCLCFGSVSAFFNPWSVDTILAPDVSTHPNVELFMILPVLQSRSLREK